MEFELRKWQISDAENVAKYGNNVKIANNLRDAFPHPYTVDDARWVINEYSNNDETRQCTRAIVVNGQAVGSIGVFVKNDVYCKDAEIGYWLGESFWNKGITSEAIKQMCKFAFQKYDIVRISAETYACNIASRKVLENAGFKLEGVLKKSIYKNGELLDSCIYALFR